MPTNKLVKKILPLTVFSFITFYIANNGYFNSFPKIPLAQSYKKNEIKKPTPKSTSTPTPTLVPTLTPTPTMLPTSVPPLPSPTPTQSPQPLVYASTMGQEIISFINQERQARGLLLLQGNGLLNTSAQNKASDMLAKNYWGHTPPDTNNPWSFIEQVGYRYTAIAENLAEGYFDARSAVNGWMNSDGHRANILGDYRDIGIGIADGVFQNQNNKIIVAHFGSSY